MFKLENWKNKFKKILVPLSVFLIFAIGLPLITHIFTVSAAEGYLADNINFLVAKTGIKQAQPTLTGTTSSNSFSAGYSAENGFSYKTFIDYSLDNDGYYVLDTDTNQYIQFIVDDGTTLDPSFHYLDASNNIITDQAINSTYTKITNGTKDYDVSVGHRYAKNGNVYYYTIYTFAKNSENSGEFLYDSTNKKYLKFRTVADGASTLLANFTELNETTLSVKYTESNGNQTTYSYNNNSYNATLFTYDSYKTKVFNTSDNTYETTNALLPSYISKTDSISNNDLSQLYYENIDGEFISISTNASIFANNRYGLDSDGNDFAILNNYEAQNNLTYGLTQSENIENLYVAFGDAYVNSLNELDVIVNALEVSLVLNNKYYNNLPISINPVINQDTSLTDGNSNKFWYQYIDLENINYYVDQDYTNTAKVLYPEGEYSFKFTYSYYTKSAGTTATRNAEYTYSINLTKDSDSSDYPTFLNDMTEADQTGLTSKDYINYYYNFQSSDYPTYSYDASKYNINYKYTYNLDVHNYTSVFKTLSRSSTISIDSIPATNEISTILYYDNGTFKNGQQIEAYYRHIAEVGTTNATKYATLLGSDAPDSTKYSITDVYQFAYNVFNYTTTKGTFLYKQNTIILKGTTIATPSRTCYFKIDYISYDNNINHYTDFVDYSYLGTKQNMSIFEFSINNETEGSSTTKEITNTLTFTYIEYIENVINTKTTTTIETINNYIFNTIIDGSNNILGTSFANSITTASIVTTKRDKTDTEIESGTITQSDLEYKNSIGKTVPNINEYICISNLNSIDFKYLTQIEFTELGVYEIVNNYTLSFIKPTTTTYSTYEIISDYTSKNATLPYAYYDTDTNRFVDYSFKTNGYKLDIFGIKAYFNKNGKTELKDDSSGIYSEFTSTSYDATNITIANQIKASGIKSNATINSTNEPKQQVPITNMTPITFENFCTYSYNGQIPESKYYIYQFTYNEDDERYITISNAATPSTNLFTKDTYITPSGQFRKTYYEVVIKYTYANYNESDGNSSTCFYQIFGFAIDSTSPTYVKEKLTTKVYSETLEYQEFTSFANNSYTNSNVRLTWRDSNFFQYSILPTYSKTKSFDGNGSSTNSGNFSTTTYTTRNASYTIDGVETILQTGTGSDITNITMQNFGNNLYRVPKIKASYINIDSGLVENIYFYPSDLVNTILVNKLNLYSSTIVYEIVKYEYQLIISATYNNTAVWGNGNYKITFYYGSSNQSYTTNSFIIDSTSIQNIEIKAVTDNNLLANYSFNNLETNLVNKNFTLIFDKKQSGASITTKYTYVPFGSTSDTNKLDLANELMALSTTNFINGESSTAQNNNNSYVYDYSYTKVNDAVYSSNIFKSSGIYIFTLTDSAGNKSNFYVIHDTSTPQIILDVDSSNYNENEKIINGLATLSWGSYKAIEISADTTINLESDVTNSTTSADFNNAFIYANKTNYKASDLSKALKEILNNTGTYGKVKLIRFWKLANGDWSEIDVKTDGSLNYEFYSGNYYLVDADSPHSTQIFHDTSGFNIKAYLLIPLTSMTFNYTNTNSDDTKTYTSTFNLSQTSSDVQSVILAPTQSDLNAELLINTSTTNGFYGEKYYDYTILDKIYNDNNDNIWMNLDKTMSYTDGYYLNTSTTQTASTKYSGKNYKTAMVNNFAYSPSQLYFSYITATADNQIPNFEMSYKYYDFDIDFYSDYTLTNIALNSDDNTKLEFTYTLTTDLQDETIISKTMKVQVIDIKEYNNHNADGDIVSEIYATYPFSLEQTAWDTTLFSTENTYTSGERTYTNIINSTMDESGNYYTKNGFYLFKRVYSDYLDTNGVVLDSLSTEQLEALGNDTIIRYYAYFIDTNKIIDLSNSIGEYLNILLGYGINSSIASDNYQTLIDSSKIENASNSANSVYSFSTLSTQTLFTSTKTLIQNTIAFDKYDQSTVASTYLSRSFNTTNTLDTSLLSSINSLITGLNSTTLNRFSINTEGSPTNENYYQQLVSKFVFGETYSSSQSYIDSRFELRLDMYDSDNASTKIISKNIIDSTLSGCNTTLVLNNANVNNSPASQTNRNALSEYILLKYFSSGNYTFKIYDSTNQKYWANDTMFYNNFTYNYRLTGNSPFGTYYGKNSYNYTTSSEYDSNSSTTKSEYLTNILSENLENLSTKSTSGIYNNTNINISKSTNNNSLIFCFEKNSDLKQAQINPYVITISMLTDSSTTPVNIFQMTSDGTFVGTNASKMQSAYLENSDKTKWAVVIYDNENELYKNLLSDSSTNAVYYVTLQYMGTANYYDYTNSVSVFNGISSIIVDNVKPLYNIIQLMEADNYIPKNNLSSLPTGYTNITTYYASLLNKNYSDLYIQYCLNNIYKIYLSNFIDTSTDTVNGYYSNGKYVDGLTKTYIQNYFFAVDEDFTFTKAIGTSDTSLDTFSVLWYREIEDITNYKFSLTIDDYDSTPAHLPNHNVFAQITSGTEYKLLSYSENFTLGSSTFAKGNYYEIIERDEAGNYTVYAIYYTDDAEYAFNYKSPAENSYTSQTDKTGTLSATATASESAGITLDAKGSDLTFLDKAYETAELLSINTYQDLFMRASISYKFKQNNINYANTNPIYIYNDPINKQVKLYVGTDSLTSLQLLNSTYSIDTPDSLVTFFTVLENVYTTITSNYEDAEDFGITITFKTRTNGDYKINYLVPGDLINYTYKEYSNYFTITIPAEDEYRITKIVSMNVYQFIIDTNSTTGIWKEVTKDKNSVILATINNLNGRTLSFAEGYNYKFVLKDNFSRLNTTYESLNVDEVDSNITYLGTTSIIDNITYTSSAVKFTVDKASYNLHLYLVITDNITKTKVYNSISLPSNATTNNIIYYNQYGENIADVGVEDKTKVFTITISVSIINGANIITYNITPEYGQDLLFYSLLVNTRTLPDNHDDTLDIRTLLFSSETYTKYQNTMYKENNFEFYTILPELVLKNLSGTKISASDISTKIFIEDLYVSWKTDVKFNIKVRLKCSSSEITTLTITDLENGYKLSNSGTYVITVYNSLGLSGSITYKNTLVTVTRAEGNVSLYSFYTKSGTTVNALIESSYTSTYTKDSKSYLLCHYYVKTNFFNYLVDGVSYTTSSAENATITGTSILPNTNYAHIQLITNTNKSLNYEIISLSITTISSQKYYSAIYRIYGGSYERYIQVHFIPTSTDFVTGSLQYKANSTDLAFGDIVANIRSLSTKTSNDAIIRISLKNEYNTNGVDKGNEIIIYHYYNSSLLETKYVKNLKKNESNYFCLDFTSAGLHEFVIKDLAGNQITFAGSTKLTINLINKIIYRINDTTPIEGQIFNTDVKLEIKTKLQDLGDIVYSISTVLIYKNGVQYELTPYTTNTYKFTEAGHYSVVITARTNINNEEKNISSTLSFRIVNTSTTSSTLDISSGSNFTILKVYKMPEKSAINENNILSGFTELYAFRNTNELWLSAENDETGSGYYYVLVETYNSDLQQTQNFSFYIWINNEYPSIIANIPFGTETTDPIEINYNLYSIYLKVGNAYIVLDDQIIETIDENSVDGISSYTIGQDSAGEHWIKIITEDGNVVASYKLTKKDPLNSTAKLVIIIVISFIVILTVFFIILRKKIRFR